MKWKDLELEKHGLFATKDILEAVQYVDEIVDGLPKKHRIWAYTAAYVMYNSVIEHYEKNMVCTKRGEKDV